MLARQAAVYLCGALLFLSSFECPWIARAGFLSMTEAIKALERGQPVQEVDALTRDPSSPVSTSLSLSLGSSSSAFRRVGGFNGDLETLAALKYFRLSADALGFMHPVNENKMEFGPPGAYERYTRLSNGDKDGLQPLQVYSRPLSNSQIPISGDDWQDLQIRPLVANPDSNPQKAIYLVDGTALRTKYPGFMTRNDFDLLGPGHVAVLYGYRGPTGQKTLNHRPVYWHKFYLKASLPRQALESGLWKIRHLQAVMDPQYARRMAATSLKQRVGQASAAARSRGVREHRAQ